MAIKQSSSCFNDEDLYRLALEHFGRLPEYGFLVCRTCKVCLFPSKVKSHVTGSANHASLAKPDEAKGGYNAMADKLQQYVRKLWPDLPTWPRCTEGGDLASCVPSNVDHPFEDLPLFHDGQQCTACGYLCRTDETMRKHQCPEAEQQSLQRESTRRGRPTRASKDIASSGRLQLRSGLTCQQFFDRGALSSFFLVSNGNYEAPASERAGNGGLDPDFERLFCSANQQREQNNAVKYEVIAQEIQDQPNPFITKAGFLKIYSGMDRRRQILPLTIDPTILEPDHGVLQVVAASIRSLTEKCARGVSVAGTNVLTELMRAPNLPRHEPFHLVGSETMKVYTDYVVHAVLFIIRNELASDRKLINYVVNKSVENDIHHLLLIASSAAQPKAEACAESDREGEPQQIPEPDLKVWKPFDPSLGVKGQVSELSEAESACLSLLISLLEQKLDTHEFESPLIVAMAALSVLGDGWMQPRDYTKRLAGLIFVSRILRLQHAARYTLARQEAGDVDCSMMRVLVQQRRDILGESLDGQWSPLSWAFDLKSFGFAVAKTLENPGEVFFENGRLLFRCHKITIDGFRSTVQGVLNKAGALLCQRLLFLADECELPEIRIEDVLDDVLRDGAGSCVSTVLAKAAKIKQNGVFWLFDHLRETGRPVTAPQFFKDGKPASETCYTYLRQVDKFVGFLAVLMHLTGGQPSRGRELISIRHTSTGNGGPRNLAVFRGRMISRINYSKTSGKARPITRVYPEPVGRLIALYVLLVRPFADTLATAMEPDFIPEEYLWRHRSEFGIRKWDSTRLSVAVAAAFEAGTGCTNLGLQDYRHVAIAFTKNMLQPAARDLLLEEVAYQEYDCLTEDDSFHHGDYELREAHEWGCDVPKRMQARRGLYDAQAGHSSSVANRLYARNADGSFTTEEYYRASLQWHALLGFGSKQGGLPSSWDYHNSRKVEQEERLSRLSQVDLDEELRALFPYLPGVKFRGQQREALEKLIHGVPALSVVMAVGTGKSLLFMLPARTGFGGTSIVLLPTRSLVSDMAQRSKVAKVSSAIWDPEGSPPVNVSLVFTTPEAFVTKAFQGFANQLLATHVLDRIFVDECHTILDEWRVGQHGFGRLIDSGLQIICLTGTLSMRSEQRMWTALTMSTNIPHYIREPTTRRNLEYSVTVAPEGYVDEDLIAMVERKVRRHQVESKEGSSPAVIVYCQNILRSREVAEALRCPAYYSNCPDQERILDDFLKERSDVIVATSALGLGVNNNSVGFVLHLGCPQKLAEYVQGSGRAGRKGIAAKAELISHKLVDWKDERDEDMDWYLDPRVAMNKRVIKSHCRRAVLARLDDDAGRGPCDVLEMPCDLCFPPTPLEQMSCGGMDRSTPFAGPGAIDSSASPVAAYTTSSISTDRVPSSFPEVTTAAYTLPLTPAPTGPRTSRSGMKRKFEDVENRSSSYTPPPRWSICGSRQASGRGEVENTPTPPTLPQYCLSTPTARAATTRHSVLNSGAACTAPLEAPRMGNICRPSRQSSLFTTSPAISTRPMFSTGHMMEASRAIQTHRTEISGREQRIREEIPEAVEYLRLLATNPCPRCPDENHQLTRCPAPMLFECDGQTYDLTRRLQWQKFTICFFCSEPQHLCPSHVRTPSGGYTLPLGTRCPQPSLVKPVAYLLTYRPVAEAFFATLDELAGSGTGCGNQELRQILACTPATRQHSAAEVYNWFHMLLPTVVSTFRKEIVEKSRGT